MNIAADGRSFDGIVFLYFDSNVQTQVRHALFGRAVDEVCCSRLLECLSKHWGYAMVCGDVAEKRHTKGIESPDSF